jgi:uncharacterized coiled-coil protein SlyX
MMSSRTALAVWAATAALVGATTGTAAFASPGDAPRPVRPLDVPPRPVPFEVPQNAPPAIPLEEPSVSASPNAGFATLGVFSAAPSPAATSSGQTLTGPVTLTYGGTSPALSLTDSGTNRALTASITNSKDANSTVYGDTVGSGAGVSGVNKGTAGPGGNFQVNNANSLQAGVFATTNGQGPAVYGTKTNKNSDYPAVYGQSLASTKYGIGVEGDGSTTGVYGYVPSNSTSTTQTAAISGFNGSNGWGVYGKSSANGSGVGGYADAGYGVFASSNSNYALYAVSSKNSAIYAATQSSAEGIAAVYGVTNGNISESYGILGVAPNGGTGVSGSSAGGHAVMGVDEGGGIGISGASFSGIGVYGSSFAGTAAYFNGNVTVTQALTVASLTYSSDKNLKTAVHEIDAKDLLQRVSDLPITSWTYKRDPLKRHVGPMAQDFHAAFGLNGDDETHISEVDIAGVSLAAIKALNSELTAEKAAQAEQIAELRATVATQARTVAEMKKQFADLSAALERLRADRVAVNRPSEPTAAGRD